MVDANMHLMHVLHMTHTLRKWRKERGLNQEALGELLGEGQPTIARWENGNIPPEKCLTVHDATGIPLHELRPDMYREPESTASEAA